MRLRTHAALSIYRQGFCSSVLSADRSRALLARFSSVRELVGPMGGEGFCCTSHQLFKCSAQLSKTTATSVARGGSQLRSSLLRRDRSGKFRPLEFQARSVGCGSMTAVFTM
jgi:hypothetical protein